MRTLGNILWHVPFLGFLSSLCTLLAGLLFLLTGIGIPIGLGLIQLARFLLTPFSCAMAGKNDLQVHQNQLWLTWGWIARILYFPVGLILSVMICLQVVALVLAKSLSTLWNPVNKVCVPQEVA